jgi:DNA-binding CsgD family transcriptional regulator
MTFAISSETELGMRILSPASAALTMVLVVFLSSRIKYLVERRPVMLGIAAGAVLSGVFLLLGNYLFTPMVYAGSVLMGASSAGVLISWGEEYRRIESGLARRVTIPCSVTAGVLIFLVVCNLPFALGVGAICCLPLASVLVLLWLHNTDTVTTGFEGRPLRLFTVNRKSRFPVSFILCLVVQSLVMGLVSQRIIAMSFGGESQATTVFSVVLIVLAASTALGVFGGRLLPEMSVQLMLPLIGMGLLGLALFDSVAIGIVSIALVMSGYSLVEICVWTILSNQVRFSDDSPLRVFGIGQLGRTSGICLGMVVGSALKLMPGAWMTSVVILTLYVFVLIMAFLKPLDKSGETTEFPATGEKLVGPGEHINVSRSLLEQTRNQYAARCEAISAEYGLSKREEEVMALLLRGNNYESIAKELYITRNTVKAHVNHIFAKVGVRTKQEFIDVVGRKV